MIALLAHLQHRFDRTVQQPLLGWGVLATCGFFFLSTMTVLGEPADYSNPGLTLLGRIAWCSFGWITLCASTVLASSIASEREDGGIALLLLTNLSPTGILFGALFSALAVLGFALLLLLPFVAICLTTGGVQLSDLLWTLGILSAHLWLSAGIAAFASVFAASGGRAMYLTFALILISWGWPYAYQAITTGALPPSLAGLLGGGWSGSGAAAALTPGGASIENYSALALMMKRFVRLDQDLSPVSFFAWSLPLGTLLFAAALSLFHWRPVRDDAGEIGAARSRRGPERSRRVWERGRAFAWKEWQVHVGGWRGIFARVLFYGVALVAALWYLDGFQLPSGRRMAQSLMGVGLAGVLLESAFAATRIFRREVDTNTWTALYLLPLSVRRVNAMKLLGGLAGAAVPLALLAAGVWVDVAGDYDVAPAGTMIEYVLRSLVAELLIFTFGIPWSLRAPRIALPALLLILTSIVYFGTVMLIVYLILFQSNAVAQLFQFRWKPTGH